MALRAEVEVRGLTGVIANIYAKQARIVAECELATERTMRDTVQLTKSFVHVITGRMRRSVKGELSPQRRAFRVFYDPAVFANDGVSYYPPYEEFGTRFREGHPAIGPAFEIMSDIYRQEISNILRRETRA